MRTLQGDPTFRERRRKCKRRFPLGGNPEDLVVKSEKRETFLGSAEVLRGNMATLGPEARYRDAKAGKGKSRGLNQRRREREKVQGRFGGWDTSRAGLANPGGEIIIEATVKDCLLSGRSPPFRKNYEKKFLKGVGPGK